MNEKRPLTNHQLKTIYDVRPGDLCHACKQPITREHIESGNAWTRDGNAYHENCVAPERPIRGLA